MSEMVERELPEGWEWANLRSLCSKITDGTHHSPVNGAEGKYKYITAKNIKPWGLDLTNITYIDEQTHKEIYARCDVKKGDILYIKDGATTGVAIVNPLDEEFSLLSSVGVFRPKENIDSNYLRYALNSPMVKKTMLANMAGVAITRLTLTKLKAAMIPLAPLDQQKRIVAKIEELFSHIDAGVEGLKKTQRLLKQYRQSVLKAAVTGELTKEWREENKDKVESAEKLLDRVLEKKQQMAKGNYKEPERIEDIPFDLPKGWVWTNLDALIFNIESGKSFKCEERPPKKDETGIIKVSAVTWGEFDSNESKTIVDESRINLSYKIQKGDFLFSRANTIELVGACVIVREVSSELLLSDKILRFVLPDEWKEWVKTCLRTQFGRNEIERLATGNQESMRNISQGNIKRIRIPLPPKTELFELIKCVNQKIDSISRLEVETNMLLAKAGRNKQSILISAFNGILHE